MSQTLETAVTETTEKDTITEAVEQDAVTEAVEQDAVTEAVEQDAVTEAVEQDAVTEAVEQDAVTEAVEQDAVTEAVEQDAVTETAEQDKLNFPQSILLKSNGKWQAQSEAVVGLSHRKANPPLPCQDAAISMVYPIPFVISADGAGSSVVSDIGSDCITRGIARFYQTMSKYISSLLDISEIDYEKCHNFALLTVKHAYGILQDLAIIHRRSIKDFRCTLLVAVIGKSNILWLKIGDGALVFEKIVEVSGVREAQLEILGDMGKGEYANFTTFIDDHLQPKDIQIGILPTENVTALFCMSDGAAEKLVSFDGSHISSRLSDWAEQLRNGKLSRHKLTESFYDKDFQKRHSGDDCSIAMLSTGLL